MNIHFNRRVFVVAALLGLGSLALAAVPNRIVYQGRLFKSGVPVTEEAPVRLTLVNPSTSAELDSELFIVPLSVTGEFTIVWETPKLDPNIDWVNTTPELRVKVGDEDLLPAEQLGVSPYSFVTRRVDVGGVDTAAIQDGAVTDAKVSTISAAKVWLPGTNSPMTIWQSTVAGQTDKIDSTKIYGTIPTVPSAHAASHVAGTDPIVGLGADQVAGTAIVGSKSTPQTIQATGNVVPLAIKPNPTVAAGTLNALEVFDTVPSTSMFIRGDGLTYFKNNVGVGTASPTEKLEVAGGNMKVSGGIAATTISASSATLAAASVTGAATAGALQVTGATNLATVSGNVGIGTSSPAAKLDVNGPIKFTSQKYCRVSTTVWTYGILVPSSWTESTCRDLRDSHTANYYNLGCIFMNSFSAGPTNGGAPNPNCGW